MVVRPCPPGGAQGCPDTRRGRRGDSAMTSTAPRRTVITAALAAAAAAATTAAARPASAAPAAPAPSAAGPLGPGAGSASDDAPVDYHGWTTFPEWLSGTHSGTLPVPGVRPGLRIARATGSLDYTDP